jgi:glycerol-3-phosphate acyltransferase PlsY
MDLGKGIVAIYLARLFIDSELTLIIIAYATVIGHCWSIFIGFKGGLGGLIMVTVLASLALKEAAIGLAVSLIILLTTRKSSWATYALQGSASVALLAEQQSPVMIVFPLGLIALHWLKRFQTRKVNPGTGYKHEVFEDLKRKK